MARISRLACVVLALGASDAAVAPAQETSASAAERRRAVVARGDSLELPGSWSAPPGDPLAHHTAGFATTLCAAVFITGLDPEDAAANVGFFTGPLRYRREVRDTVVDRTTRTVRLTLKNGITRVARQYGSQGCVALPIGEDSVHFSPSVVKPIVPPAASTPWPMGDVLAATPFPRELDSLAIARAVDTIFGGDSAMTLAVVITHNGRMIGERYAPGIGINTPLESWSMGKSLTGTLLARLIQMGVYRLDQPAPIPEWQQRPDDPRRAIRIMDIMRMSSGLRIRAPQDPDYDSTLGYPDHLYLYTGGMSAFRWAATRPQQWKPNTVGRYRNVDPVLASYLVRLGAETLKQDYHAFPQRALFDKLGIADAVIYTDPYGNFLGQGAEAVSARDWARLANLYLQDGVWNSERLLPRGYVDYVRTLAPAWVADGRPIYGGGFFWINGDGGQPLPRDAYGMLGAGGQSAWIVPSHGLVIVRIGKYRGAAAGEAARRRGVALLMEAVPRPASSTGPAESPAVALVGATLINPRRAPVPNAVVVVRDGRIVCAGPRDACASPPNARVVDARGSFVGPGFIDAHVHYSWTGWVDSRPDVADLRARYRYESVIAASQRGTGAIGRALLCAGVTSVFDAGGFAWTLTETASHEAAALAPRFAGVGTIMTTRSSRFDQWLNLPPMPMFVVLTTDSAARKSVRANAALGARAIKVGYLAAADSVAAVPLMAAIVDEARAAGIPVAVHVQHLAGTRHALRAGARLLVHVAAPEALDDETLRLLRQTGAVVIPTLTVFEGYADIIAGRDPASRYPMECVEPALREQLRGLLPEQLRQPSRASIYDSLVAAGQRNVRRLNEAGIAMAVGTDAGNPGTAHGPSFHRELELMSAAGMSAAEVFAAATIGGARVLRREHELGSIEAGKLADLLVFEADPTADVRNARSILWIMKAGVLHPRNRFLPDRSGH